MSHSIDLTPQTTTLNGTTTSNTLTNLGSGLTVNVQSGRLLISISGTLSDTSAGTLLTVALSGANTIAGSDDRLPMTAKTSTGTFQDTAMVLVSGLSAGNTVVQAQWRRFGGGSGTSTMANGRLTVTPL